MLRVSLLDIAIIIDLKVKCSNKIDIFNDHTCVPMLAMVTFFGKVNVE